MEYEFRQEDAYDFARFTGIEAKPKGDELFFKTCPYCRPLPTKGNIKSFSINLNSGQFKCFRASCGAEGNMLTLAKDFGFSLGNEIDEYIAPKRQFRRFKPRKEPIVPKDKAVEYLKSRGISERVAREYEITVQNGHENILVFPFFDEKGLLQFVKYRKTDYDRERDSNKEWCERDCKPVLFGMKQCRDYKRLIITEGQIDSLSVAEAGFSNAVSVPTGAKGFTWVPYCWDWVNKFEELVVFGDYEKGRVTLLDDIKQRFKKKISFIPPEYYKGCKDANEILQKYGAEAVAEAVNHAEQVPVNRVMRLADVKKVNIYEIPKLATGIRALDRYLCGGLPYGQVHIISGKRGDGKSTFASQLLVNAIEQNQRVLSYSGELPNYLFKVWIDLQIAGGKNVMQNDSISGAPSYFITNSTSERINNWYRDRAFLYDTSIIDSEKGETADLLDIIEQSIMQYGVRVILLDNLMTAIDLDSERYSDKYDQQSRFVYKLTRIALKFDVMILLVAHRRKNGYSSDMNDEVMGSGDITNYAGVILGYNRDDKLENNQRKLILTKNRLIGKLNTEGFILDYDEKSKRIFGMGDDVNRKYGWERPDNSDDTGDFEQISLGDEYDIPFD